MAGIGVVLVIGTGLFMWSDRAHDWRYYQMEFGSMVAEKFGEDKRGRAARGRPADLGRPTCRAPTAASPATRRRELQGLRERRASVPHASDRAAETAPARRISAARRATAVRAGRSTRTPRTARSRTGRSRSSAARSASLHARRQQERADADELQHLPSLRPRDARRRRHQPGQALWSTRRAAAPVT